MYARIWRALSDTTEALSTEALLDLSRYIVDKGVPVVVMSGGAPTSWSNVPARVDTADAEQADALLVCGDVFDNANPSAASQRQLYQFLKEARERQA